MRVVAPLVLVLLLTSGFRDPVTCTVQGYVIHETKEHAVDYQSGLANAKDGETNCVGVRATGDDRQLVLYSPNVWVTIQIAPEPGYRVFRYRWTADVAHVGAETVPIYWGYTERS